MSENNPERKKTCHSCNTVFSCYIENCWCKELPPIMAISEETDCICPECLKKAIDEKLENDHKKMIEGLDYYIENANWVFTSQYHLKRGFCCKNNCKHCPYLKK